MWPLMLGHATNVPSYRDVPDVLGRHSRNPGLVSEMSQVVVKSRDGHLVPPHSPLIGLRALVLAGSSSGSRIAPMPVEVLARLLRQGFLDGRVWLKGRTRWSWCLRFRCCCAWGAPPGATRSFAAICAICCCNCCTSTALVHQNFLASMCKVAPF